MGAVRNLVWLVVVFMLVGAVVGWVVSSISAAGHLRYCCDGLLITGHVACSAGELGDDCGEAPLPTRPPVSVWPVSFLGYFGPAVVVGAGDAVDPDAASLAEGEEP